LGILRAVQIERDVEIAMDDGVALRADVFCPDGDGAVPVVMTLGPYGKGVRYQDGYKDQWEWLVGAHPDLLAGSSRGYLAWETVDPEIWVPWGYAVVRVDSRGSGRSPGYLDLFSPRETRDYHDAIEWAAAQPWCNGKVGLCGISYYAINQWLVAGLQPPHLTAMIPWEGAADAYRDRARHGGIVSNSFFELWYPLQVLSVQHGNPKGPTDPWLNARATGPQELSEDALAANRADPRGHRPPELDGPGYREQSADWPRIEVPFLSAANWGGLGLHARGNFEAFTQAASRQKWLEVHPGRHEEWFYLPYGMQLQKRFFDHFLMGADNGWNREPPVQLHIRRPFSEQFELRKEQEWPLSRMRWTKLYLDSAALDWDSPTQESATTFQALGEDLTLHAPALEVETEITGPLAAKLFVSSSTTDADLFLTLRAFSPQGEEVDFMGALDPHTPLAQGWLRASHRKLDAERSRPGRPYHPHDLHEPLEPGTVYELDVEIWPTCIVLPAGYRLALTLGGKDFARGGAGENAFMQGSGVWLHTDPDDRPAAVFGGTTTIHSGPQTPSHLLLPIIPTAA
jgi:uncharacterized protein